MSVTFTKETGTAYKYCERLCRNHYENFPVASRFIPSGLRPHVCAVYAFARTADDFADEPGYTSGQERLDHLTDWKEKLQKCISGDIRHPVFIALGETINRFKLPLSPFCDLITAFKMDVEKNRYQSFDEVLFYCRHSANPVGELILRLFGEYTDDKKRLSDSICTALQLANFWQDITVDLKKDRIYIPREDMERFGYSEDDLRAGRLTDGFRSLLSFEIERTRELFAAGRLLCDVVQNSLRRELRMVWLGGMRILEKIENCGYDVFTRRPVLKGGDVFLSMARLCRWKGLYG